MPKPWSAKRERQYMHIKDSLIEQGRPEALAEEIAARVVNKERAQHGESVAASPSSINDMSAGRRGGLRSHQGPAANPASASNEARQRGVKGALGHEQGAVGSRIGAIALITCGGPGCPPSLRSTMAPGARGRQGLRITKGASAPPKHSAGSPQGTRRTLAWDCVTRRYRLNPRHGHPARGRVNRPSLVLVPSSTPLESS